MTSSSLPSSPSEPPQGSSLATTAVNQAEASLQPPSTAPSTDSIREALGQSTASTNVPAEAPAAPALAPAP
ncbi:hypothetical protein H4R35_003775, partial [Dimargaris xerosporica]